MGAKVGLEKRIIIQNYLIYIFSVNNADCRAISILNKSLEICCAETPFCVDSTVKFAKGLGYKLYMKRNMISTNYNDIMSPEESV